MTEKSMIEKIEKSMTEKSAIEDILENVPVQDQCGFLLDHIAILRTEELFPDGLNFPLLQLTRDERKAYLKRELRASYLLYHKKCK